MHQEGFNEFTKERLKKALKGSNFLKDEEIMDAVKVARNSGEIDKEDWWWWPEKL